MPASANNLPLVDYAATQTKKHTRVPRGLNALAHKIRGHFRQRQLNLSRLEKEAQLIHETAATLRNLKSTRFEEQLVSMHRTARRSFRRGLSTENRRTTLALLAETMRRSSGLSPYPAQILGALIMERGALAEMATGEGKTLTIGLTAALLAWRGRPCCVVTANDYLVERDAATMRDFYERCGLSVGAVTAPQLPPQRKEAYAADITYVTSKEVVADFLRDRLALQDWANPTRRLIQRFLRPMRDPRDQTVMRGLHFAIIDEADHVLIDEAVTPLIISRPVNNVALEEACQKAAEFAKRLEPGIHYDRFPRFRDIELKSAGRKLLNSTARESFPSIWKGPARAEELVRQALVAFEFFKRDEQYVLTEENKIAIVDESTGRIMPERTWRQGLHQAIEAREGLDLTLPTETLSRLSFQRFFRLFQHLSGCTGTAKEAASEFWHIYRLPVLTVPTHRPCIRKQLSAKLFPDAKTKREAILSTVAKAHAAQQPVLIGTRSVGESEAIAELFTNHGLHTEVLNASRHRKEAEIVANAGHHAVITIATNMAGRGTDIKLSSGVKSLGGLFVIVSEMHSSARIDRQLAGRCARQGEPGCVQLFASFEDDLAVRYLPKWLQAIGKGILRSRLPASQWMALRLLRFAQRRATAQAYRERKLVPREDERLNESLAFAGKDTGS